MPQDMFGEIVSPTIRVIRVKVQSRIIGYSIERGTETVMFPPQAALEIAFALLKTVTDDLRNGFLKLDAKEMP